MCVIHRLRAAACAAFVLLASAAAHAAGVCRPGQDDAAERPAPAALLGRLGRAFGMDPAALRGTGSVRCEGGRVMGCVTGANLNCGRADIRRRSAGGDAFCRDNPGSDVVPMAATGHATVFDWRCAGTTAVAGRRLAAVDRLGFMASNWRVLP